MPANRVQGWLSTVSPSAGSTSITRAWSTTPTAGNYLLAAVSADDYDAAGTMSGWTLLTNRENWTGLYVYGKVAGSSEGSVTWSPASGTSVRSVLAIAEWSGLTSTPVDKTANASVAGWNSTALVTGTTATTAQADELLVGFLSMGSGIGPNVTSWTNGFAEALDVTTTLNNGSEQDIALAIGEATVSATGAYSTGATASRSVSYCGAIVTLRIAAAGDGAVTGSGALTASDSTLSGAATLALTGTGALSPSVETLSGAATISLSGTGAVASLSPTLSGTGTVVNAVTGTGALTASDSTMSGAGALSLTGTGALSSNGATLSGAGTLSLAGTGAVAVNSPTLSGAALVTAADVVAGTGALQASPATLTGAGFVPIVGTGALLASSPTLVGVGVLTGVVGGEGALLASSPSLVGAGALSIEVTGSLVGSAATLRGRDALPGGTVKTAKVLLIMRGGLAIPIA